MKKLQLFIVLGLLACGLIGGPTTNSPPDRNTENDGPFLILVPSEIVVPPVRQTFHIERNIARNVEQTAVVHTAVITHAGNVLGIATTAVAPSPPDQVLQGAEMFDGHDYYGTSPPTGDVHVAQGIAIGIGTSPPPIV